VPEEGKVKRDNSKAQNKLNDKKARQYLERLIGENFGDGDLWITLTYRDSALPKDIEEATKNVAKFIKRINYKRKRMGLENCRYVYITEHNPESKIRFHHHLVMDGDMSMDEVERAWKMGSRNEVRRLKTDEHGLAGMAHYLTKESHRAKCEKRWNASRGLRKPKMRIVHSKQPEARRGTYKQIETYVDKMVENEDNVKEQMQKWYPEYDFTNSAIYYNDFNGRFYIHARLRKKAKETQTDGKDKRLRFWETGWASNGNADRERIGARRTRKRD
jgi:hypothetical protein